MTLMSRSKMQELQKFTFQKQASIDDIKKHIEFLGAYTNTSEKSEEITAQIWIARLLK